ncbi:MAG TPA: ribosome biogenesis GTPase Der [Actinomycetota bacterium]|nr:ribosome biogenesis GTPase Der [Actinomycetota bacterium]
MSPGPELPRVALVGRQNVGKSTLANRLVGRREAIAHEIPGVTRDRVEHEVRWRGRRLLLVDTGGYAASARGLEALVAEQAARASEQADLILLVVDARAGIVEDDAALARRLRRARVPVLVVANKVDTEREEPDAAVFHALGLGEPMPVSALHGRRIGELLDRIVDLLPETEPSSEVEGEPRFALVGRPNVGKSSLFNRLVGEERSVVFEEAGTTRDAVDAVVGWPQGRVRFVDTAGFRRPSRARGLEYYSYVRTIRAIDRSHVAVLILDATEGFTAEDRRIAARVMDAGRALVVVANKWDLVTERDELYRALTAQAAAFARAEVLRTSALLGTGVHRLPAVLLAAHERWRSRAPTAEVNRVLERAQAERPAPGGVRYLYGTQVAAGPPRFVLFGGPPPPPAYERFLENRLREAFDLRGVPIRLAFRPKRRRRSSARPRPGPRAR